MGIGEKIKQARTRAGLSQQQLADAIGVTKSIISQWELGRKGPTRENINKVAEITVTSPAYFTSGRFENSPTTMLISDPRLIALFRKFLRLSERQQQNLLELLDVAADVRGQLEKNSHPAEAQ